jgi:tetratricopeptide (TPR) repeat protein
MRIEDVLSQIEAKNADDVYEIQMNRPARERVIGEFEHYGVVLLPESYKKFLRKYNGGFICNGHWADYIWETGNLDLPRERSVYLYSIEELFEEYERQEELGWEENSTDPVFYMPPIPFGRFANGDFLMFREMEADSGESPVFEGANSDAYKCRGKKFVSFPDFLNTYLEKMGYLLSEAEKAEQWARKHEEQWLSALDGNECNARLFNESYEKRMQHYAPFIKNGKKRNEISLCLKARFCVFEKEFTEAVELCSTAIKLNPQNLWALSLRCFAYFSLLQDDNAFQDKKTILEAEGQKK